MPFEKRICYVLISILVLYSISIITLNLNLCSPFKAMWNRRLPGAKCLNTNITMHVSLSFIIAIDFAILLLPAPILRHLTLQWHQKLGIAMALSFGSVYVFIMFAD